MTAQELFKQIERGFGWIDEQELVRVCEQENLSVAEAIKLTKLLSDHDMIGAERLDEEEPTSLVGMTRRMVKEEGKGDPFAPTEAMIKRGIHEDEVKKSYKIALKEVENYIQSEVEDMMEYGETYYTFSREFEEGDGWFEGLDRLGGNKDVLSGFNIKEIYFEFRVHEDAGSYDTPASSEMEVDRKSIKVVGRFEVIEDDRGNEDNSVERVEGMALLFQTGAEDVENYIEDL